MNHKQRVAVIGAGVAGLAAAAYLAKQGFKVTVYEAQDRIGGCCTNVTLDGYTFNTGALTVILPGLLDQVFSRFGLERSTLLPLQHMRTAQRSFLDNGVTVTLSAEGEVSIEGVPSAGQAEDDLRRLLKKWDKVYAVFSELIKQPLSAANWARMLWRYLPLFVGTAGGHLRTLIQDENLRAALIGHLAYAGVDPQRLPAPALLALVAMLKEGYFMPEGGMGRIPQALAQVVNSQGGEIVLNARVNQVVVRDGRVAGLEIAEGGFVEARVVISTVSGMLTFGKLLDPVLVPARLKRKVADAPLSMRAFNLQLGLANRLPVDSFTNYFLPRPAEISRYFSPEGEEVRWGLFSVPTVQQPEMAPPGGSVLEFAPAVRLDGPLEAWDEEKTSRITQAALDFLRRRFDLQVAVSRVVTPRQYQDELLLYQGAIYGLSPAAGLLGLFSYETPIPGLYQAGQTTYPGFGVTPAAMSGLLVGERICYNSKN